MQFSVVLMSFGEIPAGLGFWWACSGFGSHGKPALLQDSSPCPRVGCQALIRVYTFMDGSRIGIHLARMPLL